MDIGTRLPEFRVDAVDAEKMKIFAGVLRDPNPIHWDREEVARRGLGTRLINQGPTNLAYVTEMLARAFGGYDRIRRVTARFTANVFEDDAVTAGGMITRRDGDEVVCEVWLDRADGERAITGEARMALPRGESGLTA
jgi:acyl dehydratase